MLWYVRNKDRVIGPFPKGQIQQAILLGRIVMDQADVSTDKEEWKPLHEYPQLIPDLLKGDTNNEQARERIAAARRWADERRRERRGDADPERRGPGRRSRESYLTQEYRDRRESIAAGLRPSNERFIVVPLVVVIVLVASIYAGFKWVPKTPAGSQCEAAATMSINWRQCNKAGIQLLNTNLSGAMLNGINLKNANLFGSNLSKADLSYADLSNSNLSFIDLRQSILKGANLRGADLSKANFTQADLSYADLRDAKLNDTILDKVNLANAIWVDGRVCLAGSVGVCQVAK